MWSTIWVTLLFHFWLITASRAQGRSPYLENGTLPHCSQLHRCSSEGDAAGLPPRLNANVGPTLASIALCIQQSASAGFRVDATWPQLIPPVRNVSTGNGMEKKLPPTVLALVRNHRRLAPTGTHCSEPLGLTAAQEALVIILTAANLSYADELHLSQERVGLEIRDTCTSALATSYQISDVARQVQYTSEAAREFGVVRPWITIGPSLSEEVLAISPQLSAGEITHVSHRATSDLFEDKNRFPYLLRTVPPDMYQTRAIVDLIVQQRWSYIGLVGSGDTYGLGGLDGLRSEATENDVCIGLEESFSVDISDVNHIHSIVKRIANDLQMSVVVIFALENDARHFLSCLLATNISRDYTIIAGEDWVTRINLHDIALNPKCAENTSAPAPSLEDVREPHVIGFFPRSVGLEDVMDSRINEVFSEQMALISARVPWLPAYVERLANCSVARGNGDGGEANVTYSSRSTCNWPSADAAIHLRPLLSLVDTVLDSVNTVDQGAVFKKAAGRSVPCSAEIAELLLTSGEDKTNCSAEDVPCCRKFTDNLSAWPLYHLIHATHVPASTGDIFEFIGTWQGISKSTPRLNINETKFNMSFPRSRCSSTCAPGTKIQRSTSSVIPCDRVCWTCVDCPSHSVSMVNNDTCEPCVLSSTQLTVPNSAGTHCIQPPVIIFNYSSVYGIAAATIVSVGVTLCLLTIVLFWTNRSESVVKTCDLHLSTFILCGFILALLSVLLAFFDPNPTICFIYRVLALPWYIFVAASMLSKLSRIKHIFSKSSLRRGKDLGLYTTVKFHVVVICAATLLCFLIALTASLIERPSIGSHVKDRAILYRFCKFHDSKAKLPPGEISELVFAIYSCSLVLILFITAFKSRNVPEEYNESYHIFISTFGSLMLIVSLTIVSFVPNTEYV
ncbi:metabotropic glutamate receptor-like [Sycon ciliatum]|uniref:metabotropic glutamate receptor-like n=1 Tax=Sycon ciliatum TaxID=27933 RepID=UPI0031F6482B